MSGDSLSNRPSTDEFSDEQRKELLREVRCQTNLHWNYRHLKSLPSELLEEGQHVEQIYLKCNLLMSLPNNLGCLSRLAYCYLNGNDLRSLPDSIGEVASLQVLDVGNNKLTSLPLTLGRLPSLRSLVAVYNQITCFPKELCGLQSLSILMLSGNNLLHLPEAISGLIGLQGLYVDHNQLRELPRSIAALPILTRISCCCNPLTHLPAVPFISRPTIFFDNNPEMSYLPFSLLRQLRSGETWNPVVIQTCRCFQEKVVINNTVLISLSGPVKNDHPHSLVLPSQITTITSSEKGSPVLPSLRELCLRYIWNEKENSKDDIQRRKTRKQFFVLTSDFLPLSLCDILEVGPVAYCDTPSCKMPIFTFASIKVVTVTVTAMMHVKGSVVPAVMYFCCDTCAQQYSQNIHWMMDEFSVWLCGKLDTACSIELI
ncbi:leucine-rich repeat-containing protein 28-like [Homarus americanus]|uniref:leucine-rich repeat-containing protein 28-like n=1 Tax=Homarus americanus TaxID=6706 RepID=UPI001C4912D6|nr:leucine-rich repeat-containing protein 28-like [Homarus americanus]